MKKFGKSDKVSLEPSNSNPEILSHIIKPENLGPEKNFYAL